MRSARPEAVLMLVVAVGLAGCSARRAAPADAAAAGPPEAGSRATERGGKGVVHVVARGETLWRIARTYGVPLDELARVNGIDDPARIEVGQWLFVPGARNVLDVPLPSEPERPGGTPGGSWLWPVDGPVTSRFGDRRSNHRHTGIDIDASPGDPVRATRAGRVLFAGRRSGYGRLVILDHGRGLSSWYAHLDEIHVRAGERIRAGARLGRAGRSGNARGVHVHFEIRRRGRPVDPLVLLPSS